MKSINYICFGMLMLVLLCFYMLSTYQMQLMKEVTEELDYHKQQNRIVVPEMAQRPTKIVYLHTWTVK